MKMAKTNEKVGTHPSGLKVVLKKYKIPFEEKRNMSIQELKKELKANNPVLICLQAWSKNVTDWNSGHYVVAIGYKGETIFFEDPSSDTRAFLTEAELDKRWHDVGEDGDKLIHWGLK